MTSDPSTPRPRSMIVGSCPEDTEKGINILTGDLWLTNLNSSHLFNISINQQFLLDSSEIALWRLQAACSSCAHIDSLVVCQWCRWMTSYCTAWPAGRTCLLDWRFTVRQTRLCRLITTHHQQRWKTGCGRKASVNRESLYDSNQWTINDNNPPVTPHITGAGKNEIPL